jgi:hypothetical protein
VSANGVGGVLCLVDPCGRHGGSIRWQRCAAIASGEEVSDPEHGATVYPVNPEWWPIPSREVAIAPEVGIGCPDLGCPLLTWRRRWRAETIPSWGRRSGIAVDRRSGSLGCPPSPWYWSPPRR